MHADNSENRTAKSGNVLDVDGRYDKVFEGRVPHDGSQPSTPCCAGTTGSSSGS